MSLLQKRRLKIPKKKKRQHLKKRKIFCFVKTAVTLGRRSLIHKFIFESVDYPSYLPDLVLGNFFCLSLKLNVWLRKEEIFIKQTDHCIRNGYFTEQNGNYYLTEFSFSFFKRWPDCFRFDCRLKKHIDLSEYYVKNLSFFLL